MPSTAAQVQSIHRFPIKSFQGESVERIRLEAHGLFADRVLALRDLETGKIVSGKHAKLGERVLDFEARFVEEPRPGEALPDVVARVGEREIRASDREALNEACSTALGAQVEIVAAGGAAATYQTDWPELEDLPLSGASIDLELPLAEAGSFADLEPLHLLTTASIDELAARAADAEIHASRFRFSEHPVRCGRGDGLRRARLVRPEGQVGRRGPRARGAGPALHHDDPGPGRPAPRSERPAHPRAGEPARVHGYADALPGHLRQGARAR